MLPPILTMVSSSHSWYHPVQSGHLIGKFLHSWRMSLTPSSEWNTIFHPRSLPLVHLKGIVLIYSMIPLICGYQVSYHSHLALCISLMHSYSYSILSTSHNSPYQVQRFFSPKRLLYHGRYTTHSMDYEWYLLHRTRFYRTPHNL